MYPSPFHKSCVARARKALGDAAGLTQFGVNYSPLPPGTGSSQRHWHTHEDELVYTLKGELVLISDDGEETLRAGDAAAFKAGEESGHHMVNRSDKDALVLEVGTRAWDVGAAHYPDIDLMVPPDMKPAMFTRRAGTPYEDIRRRSPDDG